MPQKQRVSTAAVRLGEVLQRLRLERGWTIATLARRMGMNATYLGILERGGNMPSVEALFEFAEVFNVRAWEILREFEDPTQPAAPWREILREAEENPDLADESL